MTELKEAGIVVEGVIQVVSDDREFEGDLRAHALEFLTEHGNPEAIGTYLRENP